jgi:hypothetical protein
MYIYIYVYIYICIHVHACDMFESKAMWLSTCKEPEDLAGHQHHHQGPAGMPGSAASRSGPPGYSRGNLISDINLAGGFHHLENY